MEGDLVPVVVTVGVHHFNPLPPHGGRLTFHKRFCDVAHISIHSLRMEGDPSWIVNGT